MWSKFLKDKFKRVHFWFIFKYSPKNLLLKNSCTDTIQIVSSNYFRAAAEQLLFRTHSSGSFCFC